MPSPDPELLLRRERQLEALCADEALQRARSPPRGGARRVSSASRRQSVSSSKNGGAKGLPKSDSTAASPATEWTLVTSSNSSRSSGGCRARGGEKARLISHVLSESPPPRLGARANRHRSRDKRLSRTSERGQLSTEFSREIVWGNARAQAIFRALTKESTHPCTTE